MPLVKEVLIFVSHSLQVLMCFKLEKIKSIRFSTKQYTLFTQEFYESYSYKTVAKQQFQLSKSEYVICVNARNVSITNV